MSLLDFLQPKRIYSVKEITKVIRSLLESAEELRDVRIRGEVSNFHHHGSGHMYFTLKSADSQLRCVSFKNMNRDFSFAPKDGMKLIARGYVGVYTKRGEYQLYVKEIHHDGIGKLHEEFERLKAKLEKEGLFDDEHKRKTPAYPERIGIASGTGSAALHDILKTVGRRFPCVDLVISPTVVQGIHAEASIVRSLENLNALGDLDLVILARGGGSLEDLWAFNLERVARAVFNSEVPVITGIGHQTDFTLCDFVADKRAPTPTAAAEAAVPDGKALEQRISELRNNAGNSLRQLIRRSKLRRKAAADHILFREPDRLIRDIRQHSDELYRRLMRAPERSVQRERKRLDACRESYVFRRPYERVARLDERVRQLNFELNIFFGQRYTNYKDMLEAYTRGVFRNIPDRELCRAEERLKSNRYHLLRDLRRTLLIHEKAVDERHALLKSFSPLNVLKRGYAMVYDENGDIVVDAFDTECGDKLDVHFSSSAISAEVKERRER